MNLTPTRALAAALRLAKMDLPAFPCRSDKAPACPRGFKAASSCPTTLHELWHRHPGALVGVPTGTPSGLDVLDLDARHGAAAWWEEHRDNISPTQTHRTRSGGLHLIFRHDSRLRCSTSNIASGCDVRAEGGYVIWWPAAGLPVLSNAPLAVWPQWLLDMLQRPSPPPPSPGGRIPDGRALAGLVRLVASAREGERNDVAFWAACRAGEMVKSGLLDADTAVAVIAHAAMRAGLPEREAERTAWSGVQIGGGAQHA